MMHQTISPPSCHSVQFTFTILVSVGWNHDATRARLQQEDGLDSLETGHLAFVPSKSLLSSEHFKHRPGSWITQNSGSPFNLSLAQEDSSNWRRFPSVVVPSRSKSASDFALYRRHQRRGTRLPYAEYLVRSTLEAPPARRSRSRRLYPH